MPTCNKGSGYQSTTRGRGYCSCVADNTYVCADGSKFYDTGSPASTAHILQKQDEARAARGGLPPWAPWALGGLAVGAVAWLALRR